MNAGVTMRGLGFLVLLPCFPMLSASAASGLDGAERVTLRSVVLDEERTLAVVTPASYGRSQARYPVLYLTDAEAQIGHLRATADFLARNGLIPDMIVVGIFNTARTRDLTPTRGSAEERSAFPGGGGGERFLDFVEKEVVPAIDARYRTVPLRVLAGHSFGGLLAVHALFTRPELFQAVIAASPSLGWDDQLVVREARLAKAGEGTPRALFVSLGERESSPAGLELFEDFARVAHGVPWKDFRYEWQVMSDEDHGSVVLRSYYAGLRHVFSGWRFPRPPAPAPPPTLAAVREHFRRLSERWRITVPPPEGLVNIVGYASLQRGDIDEALEVFRLNATLHPDSANVHDSLGEGLERAGQLHAALESYRRAVVTAERTGDPLLRTFREHLDAAMKRVGAQPRPSSSL
jgi:uncharacterized protein